MEDLQVETALNNIARQFKEYMKTKENEESKKKMAELLLDREKVLDMNEEIIKKYQ